MNENYGNAVRAALAAVAEIRSDDPLRPIAFQEVLRAALVGQGPPAAGATPGLRSEPRTSTGTRLAVVAERLGLDIDTVQQVFDFSGDTVSLTVQSNQLASSRSGGTEQIAILLCAARQAGLGEVETEADVIRRACDEFVRYDDSNFASTLRGLTGLLVVGGTSRARTYRLTRPGYVRAREIVQTILSRDR